VIPTSCEPLLPDSQVLWGAVKTQARGEAVPWRGCLGKGWYWGLVFANERQAGQHQDMSLSPSFSKDESLQDDRLCVGDMGCKS
jgi:hypothetical protein